MKKLAVICAALMFGAHTLYAEFDPFAKADIGFMKYNVLKSHLLDVSGNADYIKTTHTSFVPVVRFAAGYQYDDLGMIRSDERTTGRLGLSLQYAGKKNNGVRGDYYDAGFATSSYYTLQAISRFDALVFAEYDFMKMYGFQGMVGAGVGISHGAAKQMRLYQQSNDAFIGQALKPHAVNPSGYVSLGLRRPCTRFEHVTYELGYRLGITGVHYKKKIVQSQPDANAGLAAQNAYNLLSDLELVKAPTSVIFAHQLSFGFEWDF